MAKKVFIGVGHGGFDSGAVKYIIEKEYTLKTAAATAEYLKEYGIEYKLSRTADIDTDMDSKVKMCNDYKPDIVADIHFNAGGGEGFEVYRSIVGGVSKTLAENIESQVKKLIKSRGVKTKLGSDGSDYFAIIRETRAPAVLLEGGFVDSSTDSEFIKSNYKKLAKAYADGIAQTLGAVKDPDKPDAKILDKSGYKKGDSTIGVLSMKELLLIAKKLGINKYNMNEDGVFGDGTIKSVNYLLDRWGYSQNGIAGSNFIKKLHSEIDERMK